MNCLLCGKSIHYDLSWQVIWSFSKLEPECICKKCKGHFHTYQSNSDDCCGCGRTLNGADPFLTAYEVEGKRYCYDCYRWLEQYPHHLVQHSALLVYNDSLREWLYQYKYRADARLAKVMAPVLREGYRDYKEFEWIVLPSSPKSIAERGFHATGYLLECANIPYSCPFDYVGDGNKQARKNRQERLKLAQPFALNKETFSLIQSKKWLIFDDVYTTGATILKAKELLLPYVSSDGELISISLGRDVLQE